MNKKVCLKSDGTLETGMKIIKYLESLGGENPYCYTGTNVVQIYYFINKNNYIDCISKIPTEYALIDLPKDNSYPKVMLVSDNNKNWVKRVVFMEKCNKFLAWVAESLEESEKIVETTPWNYAKDIPEETIVELTLKDISEKTGIPVHLIRIKK